MLQHLMHAYGHLCSPRNTQFRLNHQKLACELRDAIADLTNFDAEIIQNFSEACGRAAEEGK